MIPTFLSRFCDVTIFFYENSLRCFSHYEAPMKIIHLPTPCVLTVVKIWLNVQILRFCHSAMTDGLASAS